MNSNNNLFGATMRYGLVFGALVIVFNLMLWPIQMSETSGLGSLALFNFSTWVIEVFVLIYFMKKFRDKVTNKTTTFSQSYMVGILTIVFGAIIVAIYNFIFHSWIVPDFAERWSEMLPNKIINFYQGFGIGDDEIDQAMKMFDNQGMAIQSPVQTMIGSLKANFIGGAILSIIGALIVKKNRPQNGFESAMSEIEEDKN